MELIVLAAILLVAVIVIIPQARELLLGSGEKGQCQLTFILSHLGETEQLSGCKMHNVIVTPEILSKGAVDAKKEYNALLKKGQLGDVGSAFNSDIIGDMEEWAYYEIIANEMAACYDKTLAGKLLEEKWWESKGNICVICSRIALTPEAASTLSTRTDVFRKWLANVPYKGMTYPEYIQQRLVISPGFFESLSDEEIQRVKESVTTYPYTTDIKQPLAIMLAHIPFGVAPSEKPDLNWVQVYQYDSIFNIALAGLWHGSDPVKCETTIGY